jgi:hypothetical protein
VVEVDRIHVVDNIDDDLEEERCCGKTEEAESDSITLASP